MAAEIFNREYRRVLGEIYTGEGKCRVESEVILPDYKDAARRILRVDTKTRVNHKNVYLQGQTIICEVEGVASFHILYLAEKEKETSCPSAFLTQDTFSYTFKIPCPQGDVSPDEIISRVDVTPENNSFKLLGPRKMTVRSDVNVALNVKSNRTFSYFADPFPEDIQTKKSVHRIASLVAVQEEDMAFSETIVLPASYLPIGEICEMDVDLFCGKVEVEDGGIRISGSLDIHGSYVSCDETFVSFYQPIDFEKRMGISSCTKDSICQVTLTPNFLKAGADINAEGENKNILFEIGLTAEVGVFANESVHVLEDAFSTDCQLVLDTEEIGCEEIFSSAPFQSPLQATIPLDQEGVDRIESVKCSVQFRDSYLEEGKIVMEGRLHLRFLGSRDTGDLTPHEAVHDFKIQTLPEGEKIPEKVRDMRIEILGVARGVELTPEGGSVRLQCDVSGHMMIYLGHSFHAVKTMEKGEKKEKTDSGILFCYPQKTDTLWSLCKRHSLSEKKVCEENGIDGDPLPRVIHVTQ